MTGDALRNRQFYGHAKSFVRADDEELSAKKTKAGWTVGAGAEYAITNNPFKTEYLYTDVGRPPGATRGSVEGSLSACEGPNKSPTVPI